jgi:hypothetical protein
MLPIEAVPQEPTPIVAFENPPQPRDAPGTRPPTDHERVTLLVDAIRTQLNAEREGREKESTKLGTAKRH